MAEQENLTACIAMSPNSRLPQKLPLFSNSANASWSTSVKPTYRLHDILYDYYL